MKTKDKFEEAWRFGLKYASEDDLGYWDTSKDMAWRAWVTAYDAAMDEASLQVKAFSPKGSGYAFTKERAQINGIANAVLRLKVKA